MGLFDKIFGADSKKVFADVMDSIAEGVQDGIASVEKALNESSLNTAGDETNCNGSAAVVKGRIKSVLETDFPGYELRENVTAAEAGISGLDYTYRLAVYKDGVAVVLINLFENSYSYKTNFIKRTMTACADQRIGYVHFFLRLPNLKSYISEKLHETIV